MIDFETVAEQAVKLADKLNKIAPTKWKGNDAPDPHHFDGNSIKVSAKADLGTKLVTVTFYFNDMGTTHNISAVVPVEQLGKAGPNEDIELDGEAMQDGDFIIGHREGFDSTGYYARIVCSFKFFDTKGTQHNYRFDGAVVGSV